MVSIVVEYNEGDRQLFEHYWCPLLYKYSDQKLEFQFVDNTSKLNKIMPNVKSARIVKDASVEKKYKDVVYTSIDSIPSYFAMVVFKNLNGRKILAKDQDGQIIKNTYSASTSNNLVEVVMYKVERE